VSDDLWEKNSEWWQTGFTAGADPEYEEQVIPLAREWLRGFDRVLDVGTGEGQIARVAAELGASRVVGVDPTANQVRVAHQRAGGPTYARAGAEALPFRDQCFDAVLACLVFEHIPDHRPAIAELARVLEPGGRFVFFFNHPLLQAPNSGWIIDHTLDEQYWRIGAYLVEEVAYEELAPGVILPFVHRPISQYVNALAENGLYIERMEEPAPPEGFLKLAPEYRDAASIPRLLLLVARKFT
jgi:SAM-dependent methyltransferase